MKKEISTWTVEKLAEYFQQINFPEYQREANLWTLVEKQRLIDSMIRQFDIASLYFYEHNVGYLDCVDGRQRIGAIMAFLGESHEDSNNEFVLRVLNEIAEEEPLGELASLNGKTLKEIKQQKKNGDANAKKFLDRLLGYEISIVKLSESQKPEEFNLQFTRLNLGTIINSGEKLNAMIGDMRDECFENNRLGRHPFLEATRIPTRRYAREQVAALILAQVFSLQSKGEFRRTRYFDLQSFFKQYRSLDKEQKKLIEKVKVKLDLLAESFQGSTVLKNRAITVSAVLLAWETNVETQEQANELEKFITEFQSRLNWQIKKGLEIDLEYRHLVDFQRHVTQASAEKPSYGERARRLKADYELWTKCQTLTGDKEWQERHPGRDPSREAQESSA